MKKVWRRAGFLVLVASAMLSLGSGCADDPNDDPAGNNGEVNNGDTNNSNNGDNNGDTNNQNNTNNGDNNGTDCVDNDRDGFFTGNMCDQLPLDCDDSNSSRNPGAAELCDGLDNDCDNDIDEDLASPACRLTLGVCAGTTQVCNGVGGFGLCDAASYGPSYREVEDGIDEPDSCDGLDNDCDGQVDEGCPCQPGDTVTCGQDVGACQTGVQTCVNGQFGPCEGAVEAADELCDGLDNDCDGQVDESLTAPDCSAQDGVCAGAKRTCMGDQGWAPCGAQEYGMNWVQNEDPAQAPEVCDRLDNDCDGQTDEGCGCLDGEERPCGLDVGACQPGTQTCINGEFGDCRDEVGPVMEICDGIDNDCDGEVDEDLTAPACALSQGVCQGASKACGGEAGWLDCDAETYGMRYRAEEDTEADGALCDGADNDCDGQQDEGCECVDEEIQSCGSNIGTCQVGTQTCANGRFGACVGQVPPADEVCDGMDNDCDGETDEELPARNCLLTEGVCAGAQKTCAGAMGFLDCTADNYGPAYEQEETSCDRRDNDCDGEVDEGCECVDGDIQSCGSNVGVCEQGTQTCANGQLGPCEGEVTPGVEICDGLDNDCDGSTDEGLVAPDCALTQGVCAGAKQTCGGQGGFMACAGPEYGAQYDGAEEIRCDGLDNDCDGEVDEHCECQPEDTQVCGSDVGLCQQGVQGCVNGQYGACEGEVVPAMEICDGMDNDCDGSTDEELTQACPLQVGVCRGAVVACEGGDFGGCGVDEYGPRYTQDEGLDQCDGFDNDCDGVVDEGCAPPPVLISEVLYDQEGPDTGEMTFIELSGPALTRLGGLSLEAVNGSNGEVYLTVPVPNLQMPFNDTFLIVGEGASGVLRDIADLIVPDVDLQNGPDSLRLVWNLGQENEQVVDAVGYGNFGEGDVFAGEGNPTTDPRAGQSITRLPDALDTNDNAVDFVDSSTTIFGRPTPGGLPVPRVHVNLSWGTDNDDLDLHYLNTDGEFGSDNDCYFANRNPEWANPESLADNPRLDRDDVNGYGPEYMDHIDPAVGRYLVQVFVWRSAAEVPTEVTIFVDGGGEEGVNQFTFTASLTDNLHWAVAEIVVTEDGITVEARDETGAEPFNNVQMQ